MLGPGLYLSNTAQCYVALSGEEEGKQTDRHCGYSSPSEKSCSYSNPCDSTVATAAEPENQPMPVSVTPMQKK